MRGRVPFNCDWYVPCSVYSVSLVKGKCAICAVLYFGKGHSFLSWCTKLVGGAEPEISWQHVVEASLITVYSGTSK